MRRPQFTLQISKKKIEARKARRLKKKKEKKENAVMILHEVMSTLESTGSYGHLSLTHISKTQRPGDFSKDRVD
jgi:hypothetical protein